MLYLQFDFSIKFISTVYLFHSHILSYTFFASMSQRSYGRRLSLNSHNNSRLFFSSQKYNKNFIDFTAELFQKKENQLKRLETKYGNKRPLYSSYSCQKYYFITWFHMFSFDKNSLVKQLLYCSSPRCIFKIEINRVGESERKVKERRKFPLLLFCIRAIGNNIQDGNKFLFLSGEIH